MESSGGNEDFGHEGLVLVIQGGRGGHDLDLGVDVVGGICLVAQGCKPCTARPRQLPVPAPVECLSAP